MALVGLSTGRACTTLSLAGMQDPTPSLGEEASDGVRLAKPKQVEAACYTTEISRVVVATRIVVAWLPLRAAS